MAVVYQSPLSPTVSTPTLTFEEEGWCLFDNRVALLDVEPYPTMAYSTTSNNRTVRASLHLAAPPSSSVIQLYTDDEVCEGPSVVAADDDLLLIHMVVPFKGRRTMKCHHNFFVFNASSDLSRMQSLPPPPDWVARGEDTGIIKRGEGFVVASLMPRIDIDSTTGKEVQVEVAFVWIFRSGTDKEWDIRQLDMPHDSDKGLVEFHWQTDAVFSFDGFICWVDYLRGILLCDVCNADPELRFLRFPGIEIWSCSDRALPTRYRTVSICRGRMKFLDVDNGRFRSTKRDENGSTEGNGSRSNEHNDNEYTEKNGDECSITTWILKIPQYEWEVDSVLKLGELWSHRNYRDSPLPQTVPTFPVVNMMEPNILHFIVKGPGFFDNAWMVTIDMKKKSLGPYQLYENPVKEGDYSFDISHVYPNSPMISSKITKCMNVPAGN